MTKQDTRAMRAVDKLLGATGRQACGLTGKDFGRIRETAWNRDTVSQRTEWCAENEAGEILMLCRMERHYDGERRFYVHTDSCDGPGGSHTFEVAKALFERKARAMKATKLYKDGRTYQA